jgi:hypothetical protein
VTAASSSLPVPFEQHFQPLSSRCLRTELAARQCAYHMFAHEWLRILERLSEDRDVLNGSDVAEHHGRVALEFPQLGALQR